MSDDDQRLPGKQVYTKVRWTGPLPEGAAIPMVVPSLTASTMQCLVVRFEDNDSEKPVINVMHPVAQGLRPGMKFQLLRLHKREFVTLAEGEIDKSPEQKADEQEDP